MKPLILLLLVLSFFDAAAQIQFEEVLPPIVANLEGVKHSSLAIADIDNDNDQDLLITGENKDGHPTTNLYVNDGNSNFEKVPNTSLEAVSLSSVDFADIDNDNDQDLLILGVNNSSQPIAKLYTNDGNGNFTEVTGTPFVGVGHSSLEFEDIDGDTDQDVLISGLNNSFQAVTKLYINDGIGNYSEVTNTNLIGVENSSNAFEDIDGDNDRDLLITGIDNSNQKISKLYTNDGNGNFTEVFGVTIDQVSSSSVVFGDVDGDSDMDLFITGENSLNQSISKLYLNDGLGSFSLLSGTPFIGVKKGDAEFSDIDNDNDLDILLTGQNSSNQTVSNIYVNDGSANYIELTSNTLEGVYLSSVAFEDLDGDNNIDIVITGENNFKTVTASLYINLGGGNFKKIVPHFFGVSNSSVAFADIDGDLDKDVLVTGKNNDHQETTTLYENDGMGYFTRVVNTVFDSVWNSSVAFSDVDGDNDEDLLITGENISNEPIAKLYFNDGSGNYTLQTNTPFEGVKQSSIAFSDVDGDLNKDVLITGIDNTGEPTTKLYMNDGSGFFTEDTTVPFEDLGLSSVAFSDVDGDSDEDVLITGVDSQGQRLAKLYKNDGGGSFTEFTGTPFQGVNESSIAFADVDNDGDLDVLITGGYPLISNTQEVAILYLNDGLGNFTEDMTTSIEGLNTSSVAFSDVDNDNDQDLLITGYNGNERVTKLYINYDNGSFIEFSGVPFVDVNLSSIAFADVDTDGKIDVMISGWRNSGHPTTKLYRNLSCPALSITLDSTSLPTINEDCEVTALPAPTATADCGSKVIGTPNVTFPITGQGSTQITWTYSFNAGQTITQTQDIVINDVTPPTPNWPTLPEINALCVLNNPAIPQATDECSGVIMATTNTSFPLSDQNITSINWTYEDLNGNISNQTQSINWLNIDVSTSNNGTTIFPFENNATYHWLDCDNNYQQLGVTTQNYTPTTSGNYAVEITQNGCADTSDCVTISIANLIKEEKQNITLYPNPTRKELILSVGNTQEEFEVVIYDALGSQIQNSIFHDSKDIHLTLEGSPGIYFIEARYSSGNKVFRVIKQ